MANALPVLSGVMSFIQGNNANNANRGQANAANRNAGTNIDAISGIARQMMEAVQRAISGGAYDADKGWAKLDEADRAQEGLEQSSAAARLRSHGFKQGDSTFSRAWKGIKNMATQRRETNRQRYMWENTNQLLGALGAPAGLFGDAAGLYSGQESRARSRMQNPSNFLSSFIPTLQQSFAPGGWLH